MEGLSQAVAKSIEIRSPIIMPGASWSHVILFSKGRHLHVDLSVESAAYFDWERLEPMTSGEVLAETAGRVSRPGLYMRARNRSDQPRALLAFAQTTVDPEAVRFEIEQQAEDAWARGGDPVTPEDLRRLCETWNTRRN